LTLYCLRFRVKTIKNFTFSCEIQFEKADLRCDTGLYLFYQMELCRLIVLTSLNVMVFVHLPRVLVRVTAFFYFRDAN